MRVPAVEAQPAATPAPASPAPEPCGPAPERVVEVRIGVIEIYGQAAATATAPEPAHTAPAAPATPQSQGFADFTRLRAYAPSGW
jgi:hypothetical protein